MPHHSEGVESRFLVAACPPPRRVLAHRGKPLRELAPFQHDAIAQRAPVDHRGMSNVTSSPIVVGCVPFSHGRWCRLDVAAPADPDAVHVTPDHGVHPTLLSRRCGRRDDLGAMIDVQPRGALGHRSLVRPQLGVNYRTAVGWVPASGFGGLGFLASGLRRAPSASAERERRARVPSPSPESRVPSHESQSRVPVPESVRIHCLNRRYAIPSCSR